MTPSGIFTVLKNFYNPLTGGYPEGSLVQGAEGNFYGMTSQGGTYDGGTIFKITAAGELTVIRHLSKATDGGSPFGNLCRNSDGMLYGMTYEGGSNLTSLSNSVGSGTVFKISTSGSSFTVLNSLRDGAKGMTPEESLLLSSDGNYYGTTYIGGTYNDGTLYLGYHPQAPLPRCFPLMPSRPDVILKGTLVQAADGSLYGITQAGGANNYGTLFKLTTSGVFSVLHTFQSSTGGWPEGALLWEPMALFMERHWLAARTMAVLFSSTICPQAIILLSSI